MDSELANFIEQSLEPILEEAVKFARSVTGGADLDVVELRDHIPQILEAIIADLRTEQTRAEGVEKSKGQAPEEPRQHPTAAATHALTRARSGYSISGLVSEYRALRSSVLRLWGEARGPQPVHVADVTRFNEAIDQAIAESVAYYADEVERWRDVFLGVLGHELRNPLNAIVMSSELIARMSVDTPIAPVAAQLRNSGMHMGKLLNKLLVYNRAQFGIGIHVETADVDLAEEARQEVELLKAALPGARIEFCSPGHVHGRFDAARLREVVSNLVVNARKYGSPDTEIRVVVRDFGARVELEVSNDGKAIEPGAIERMFDPLRRGATARDGDSERVSLGLGLFIVKQIAEAHGGTIRAASDEGKTTFTLDLPKG